MVGGGRSQVGAKLQIVPSVKSLMFFTLPTFLVFFENCDLEPKVGPLVRRVLQDAEDELGMVQTDVFLAEPARFEQFDDGDLFAHAYFAANAFQTELQLLALGQVGA